MQFVKRTGLAVVLALALGASLSVAAASASKPYFTAGSYPATLKGIASSQEFTKTGGRSFRCSGAGLNVEATLLGRSDSLSAASSGAECKDTGVALETGTKLAMNGCKYTFHVESEIGTGVYEGTADLGPFGCGPMTLNGSKCERKFAAQWGMPVTFRNVGTGEKAATKVEITNGSLLYTTAGGEAICGGGVQQMSLTGSWEATAYKPNGEQVSASISEPSSVGISLGGKESAEEAKQPRFEAEAYPAIVNANQKSGEKYTLALPGGRRLSCEKGSLQGSLSGPASKLALTPDLRGCTMLLLGNEDLGVVVDNSCSLRLNALNVGPPYAGSLDVTCSKEGDALEVLAYANTQKQAEGKTLCIYRIGAQSGLTNVSLENNILGLVPGISISFGIEGISLTKSKGTETNCGEEVQKGTLTGSGKMTGLQ